MEIMDQALFNKLTRPGPRLAWITKWLMEEVWSPERYQSLSPVEFLRAGEDKVNRFEMLAASAADRIYGELLSVPNSSKNLLGALSDPNTAVVVFDGLSIREAPMIPLLAQKSGHAQAHPRPPYPVKRSILLNGNCLAGILLRPNFKPEKN